jgi:hypothetical protein
VAGHADHGAVGALGAEVVVHDGAGGDAGLLAAEHLEVEDGAAQVAAHAVHGVVALVAEVGDDAGDRDLDDGAALAVGAGGVAHAGGAELAGGTDGVLGHRVEGAGGAGAGVDAVLILVAVGAEGQHAAEQAKAVHRHALVVRGALRPVGQRVVVGVAGRGGGGDEAGRVVGGRRGDVAGGAVADVAGGAVAVAGGRDDAAGGRVAVLGAAGAGTRGGGFGFVAAAGREGEGRDQHEQTTI